jgi:hypothetical protein
MRKQREGEKESEREKRVEARKARLDSFLDSLSLSWFSLFITKLTPLLREKTNSLVGLSRFRFLLSQPTASFRDDCSFQM